MPRKKDDTKYVDRDSKEPDDRSSLLKRLMETGLDVFGQTEDGLRQLLADFSLPKEFVKYLIKSTDKARAEIVRIVGKEFKEFLERINITEEVLKVLTGISLEVKAEVRFKRVLDEQDSSAAPSVKGKVRVKKHK